MLNKDLFYSTIEKFDISVDAAAFNRLDTFAEMLIETNKSFNLTAIKEPDDVTVKHFADCLAIFKYVDIPENAKIIDVGTGAGFPGLVLKLARPDINMTFLDSTKKKLGFIENVLNECGVKGETLHMRAEEAAQLSSSAPLAAYAQQRLKELQRPAREITYTRRFMPDLRPGDIVGINYPKAMIDGEFRIKSQTIELGYGCDTEETVYGY